MPVTNGREIAGFCLTHALRIGLQFVIVSWLLTPVFAQLARNGGRIAISALSIGLAAVMWLAALPVFVGFRALFGGVPAVVAPGREGAFTSTGAEIGAYALSFVIEAILSTVFATFAMSKIYSALLSNNLRVLVTPVSLVYSVAVAALFFLIFIALRLAFAGPRAASPVPHR
jgi:hypothetical protein